jgi:glyoxylase-like metal-dependent hydrolase (beta-lactamase superfamily II)
MLHRDVAPGIHRVEDAYTNWYIVDDGGQLTIVDAGLPASWQSLESALAALGRSLGDVAAVILTHAHADHIGFAERARTELHIPVWLHERDTSLSRHPLRYEQERSPLGYAVRNPRLLLSALAMGRAGGLRTRPLGDVRGFAEEAVLDVPGHPKPVHTPGHTHGHTSFHFPDRDVVIAGDALSNGNLYSGRPGPQIMAAASNVDSRQALASLQALADTRAGTVLVGHGEPITGGVEAAVAQARELGPS